MTTRHRSSSLTPSEQLKIVMGRIYSSREGFIRVVKFLLADCRAQRGTFELNGTSNIRTKGHDDGPMVQDPRSMPKLFKTLDELLAESTGHKRGREITHYDGIPISIIRASSPPPLIRQISSPRRIRLNKCFGNLMIENTVSSVQRDKPTSELGYGDNRINDNLKDGEGTMIGGTSDSGGSSTWADDDSDEDGVVFII